MAHATKKKKKKTKNQNWKKLKKNNSPYTFDPLIKWQKLRISNYYYNNNINNAITTACDS